jgi:hypothetical protein
MTTAAEALKIREVENAIRAARINGLLTQIETLVKRDYHYDSGRDIGKHIAKLVEMLRSEIADLGKTSV